MVLADLSNRLTNALHSLNSKTVIDEEAIDACLKEIASALLQADVNVRFVSQMRSSIKNTIKLDEAMASGTNKRKLIQKCVFDELCKLLTPDRKPFKLQKGKPNVVMFVGLQGSGKTTTCTKYAHWHARKGWKTCMVCADTFRAGAFDQLKQNATKARIPFYGSYTETDPVKIAEDGVKQFRKERYDLIIVDTSGRHKQEQALFDEMQQVSDAVQPDEVIFVMDSHIGQACFDQAKAFNDCVDVGSVIVTKLDGHAKGGGALSAVSATNAPVIFVGTGEHFDDFDVFEPRGFVSRLLGMGDLKGLVDTIKDVLPLDKQPEMMQRLAQGVFTMRDLYEQLQNVTKLGPMSKVMSMIPGMNAGMMPQGMEQAGVDRVKKFMTMMDSMTDDELDGKTQSLDKEPSRCLRIAKGSGVYPIQVGELLAEHKKFEKMVSKMGKTGLMGKSGDLTNMMRNPKQVMGKLQQCMDPKMLAQMGGAGNLMNVMKQMEQAEGMEDMMGQLKAMKGGMKGGRRK